MQQVSSAARAALEGRLERAQVPASQRLDDPKRSRFYLDLRHGYGQFPSVVPQNCVCLSQVPKAPEDRRSPKAGALFHTPRSAGGFGLRFSSGGLERECTRNSETPHYPVPGVSMANS
jgi:hypothetical protein